MKKTILILILAFVSLVCAAGAAENARESESASGVSYAAGAAENSWECVSTPDAGFAEADGENITLSFSGAPAARSASAEKAFDLSENGQINLSFTAKYSGKSTSVNRRIYLRNSATKATELINISGGAVRTLGQSEIFSGMEENKDYSFLIGIKPESADMVIYIDGEKVFDDNMGSKWKSFDLSAMKVYIRNNTTSKDEAIESEFTVRGFNLTDRVSAFTSYPSDGDAFVDAENLSALHIDLGGAATALEIAAYKGGEPIEAAVELSGLSAEITPSGGFEENAEYSFSIISATDLFGEKAEINKTISFTTASSGYVLPTVSISADKEQIYDTTSAKITVSASSELGIEKTELYENGALVKTFSEGGEYIFRNSEGKYTFYAAAYDINGGKSVSDEITVTVLHNEIPKISVSGVTSGEAASPSELKSVLITALDPDGSVTYIGAEIDGEIIAENFGGALELDLSGTALGLHSMKITAKDNCGGEAEEIIKLIVSAESNVRQIVFNDFEGYSSDGSTVPSGLPYPAITGDAKIMSSSDFGAEHGTVAVFKTDGEAVDGQTANGSWARLNTTGTIYSYSIEMDLYQLSEFGKTYFIFKHPSQSVAGAYIEIYGDKIKIASTSGSQMLDFKHGEWHHIRFDVDMVKHCYSFWLDGEKVADKYGISPALTQIDTRLVLDMMNTSEYMGYALDNLSIKYIEPSAQFTDVGYDGEFGGAKVSPVAKTLDFKLNAKLTAATLSEKTVLLYDGERQMKTGKISYNSDSGILTVAIGEKLKSDSKYKLTLTDKVSDSGGLPLVNGASAVFETGYAPLDVISGSIKKKGGRVRGEAVLTNTTGAAQECFLILNIFSGNTPVDTSVCKITVPEGDNIQISSNELDISGSESAELYVWKSLDGQEAITPLVFK